jgi:hypothetical protein
MKGERNRWRSFMVIGIFAIGCGFASEPVGGPAEVRSARDQVCTVECHRDGAEWGRAIHDPSKPEDLSWSCACEWPRGMFSECLRTCFKTCQPDDDPRIADDCLLGCLVARECGGTMGGPLNED